MMSLFISCDSSDDPATEPIPERENQIEVGETKFSDIRLLVAYSGTRGETGQDSYPLEVYLYDNSIAYTMDEGLIENGFAHIRLNLWVSTNGIPTEGTYTFNSTSDEVLNVESGSQTTDEVGILLFPLGSNTQRIFNEYEGAGLNNVKLSVTHQEEGQYTFELEANDNLGNHVIAYYKGGVSMTMIYSEEE